MIWKISVDLEPSLVVYDGHSSSAARYPKLCQISRAIRAMALEHLGFVRSPLHAPCGESSNFYFHSTLDIIFIDMMSERVNEYAITPLLENDTIRENIRSISISMGRYWSSKEIKEVTNALRGFPKLELVIFIVTTTLVESKQDARVLIFEDIEQSYLPAVIV
jgi:hypothetical protein